MTEEQKKEYRRGNSPFTSSVFQKRPFNCWIDPNGAVHTVGLFGHAEFAQEQLGVRAASYEGPFIDGCQATQELHDRGWARIHTRSEQSYAQIVVPNEFRVSRKLYEGILAAYEICQYHEIWEWLRQQSYIQDMQLEGNKLSP